MDRPILRDTGKQIESAVGCVDCTRVDDEVGDGTKANDSAAALVVNHRIANGAAQHVDRAEVIPSARAGTDEQRAVDIGNSVLSQPGCRVESSAGNVERAVVHEK